MSDVIGGQAVNVTETAGADKGAAADAVKSVGVRPVALMGLIHFAGDMYPGMISPLLPHIRSALSLSRFEVSIVPAVASVTMACQPLFGLLADRTGWRGLLVVGLLASSLCYSTMLLAGGFVSLILLVIGGGLGVAAFHPQAAAMAGRVSNRERNWIMAVFVSGGTLGFGLGGLSAPILLSHVGRWGPAAASLIGISVAILVWRSPALTDVPRRRAEAAPRDGHRERVYLPVLLLLAIVVIRAVAICGFINFLPLYYQEKGRSLVDGAWPLVVFVLVGAIGNTIGGRIADRFGGKVVLFVSNLAGAALLLAFTRTDGIAAYVLLWGAGIVLNASVPVNIVAAQELAPNRAGFVSSLMMGFGWGIGGMLVPAFGYVADLYQSFEPALVGLALVPLLAAAASLPLPARPGAQRGETGAAP